MSEQSFTIIGISDSHDLGISPEALKAINSGKIFSGGRRHHEIVRHLLPPDSVWIDITVPISGVIDAYSGHDDIVVFASGDPLFYGFAVTLRRLLPEASIRMLPAFNSLQSLAHRILLPYSDMVNVSVTGRPWKSLDIALMRDSRLIGVLTDRKKGPAEIASRMLDFGYVNYTVTVGELLGNEKEERIRQLAVEETAKTAFRHPNCVILQMTHPRKRHFGIPENEFHHLQGRENMITKMPVRLLSLSMLDLTDKKTLWDIGFCTGSVSIEAALRFPELEIVAFERREESRELLDANCRKFGVPGITGVISDFMDCDLSQYPAPNAVFIGGHGGHLREMVARIQTVLRPDGVIVFNSVSEESLEAFRNAIEMEGMTITDTHRIALDTHNPITILKAK